MGPGHPSSETYDLLLLGYPVNLERTQLNAQPVPSIFPPTEPATGGRNAEQFHSDWTGGSGRLASQGPGHTQSGAARSGVDPGRNSDPFDALHPVLPSASDPNGKPEFRD